MEQAHGGKVQTGFTAPFQESSGIATFGAALEHVMPSPKLCVLPFLLLAIMAGTAVAGQRDGRTDEDRHDSAPRATQARDARAERRSLAEDVRRVKRATGGQILSAERVPFDGRDMNRIKVVDSTGRVRVVTGSPRDDD